MTLDALYSVHDIAIRCGVDVTFIDHLIELGVITTYPGRERRFACEVTLRVAKFVRIQRDLGVNPEGAALIVELLDRIDALEHRLRQF